MFIRNILAKGIGLCAAVLCTVCVAKLDAFAYSTDEILSPEQIGASLVFETNAYNNESIENLGIELAPVEDESLELVMADVSSVLNVREAPDIESAIVGKIYRDCGGRVLEKGEEWTLIETGELVGYASNEYLLFGEEAEALARDVGTVTAGVKSGAVVVRAEKSVYSECLGYMGPNSILEVIDESDDLWVMVAYGDLDGYVLKKFVNIDFSIDHGETMAAIKERKRQEELARLALIRQREAMKSDDNMIRFLGALIQCEAGGEPYEGQLAVGAVVMNRVRSKAYPDTLYDVIYASGQFTPAKTGSLERVYNNGPRDICMQAAKEALNGYTNVGDYTHFRRKGNREGFIIGNHVFY